MSDKTSDLTERIRQQFDAVPFPGIPLEQSPKDDSQALYIHNLVTSYYLRTQKYVETEGKLILDAGCGTGYKSLILAHANPGAKIIGIDLSENSVEMARERLRYHGFEQVEFHAISIEELPSLGLQFDYINNDEVLYLLPDMVAGLQAMKSVLKPDGIIRTNLHSSLGRHFIYCGQEVCKMMGLLAENPGPLEIELLREFMTGLRDEVTVKVRSWRSDSARHEGWICSNHLLVGDKGYTIPEMFAALRTVELDLISMVNWSQWNLRSLFKEPDNLPAFLEMSLPEIAAEEVLHLFELLHPVHRLLDFWCAHPRQGEAVVPVSEWTPEQWQKARVHLHPQLRTVQVKEDLLNCIASQTPFEISRYVPLPTLTPLFLESLAASVLLPLWEAAQSVQSLAERWLQIRPLHPVTLEPVSQDTALEEVSEILKKLEACVYVLLERAD